MYVVLLGVASCIVPDLIVQPVESANLLCILLTCVLLLALADSSTSRPRTWSGLDRDQLIGVCVGLIGGVLVLLLILLAIYLIWRYRHYSVRISAPCQACMQAFLLAAQVGGRVLNSSGMFTHDVLACVRVSNAQVLI